MYVIEVIPLVRGVAIESLSYFSTQAYPLGTIIAIPVRGKQVHGVALSSKPVSSTKTALKAATFSLRKLPTQTDTSTLPTALLDTITTLHERTPSKIGAIMFSLLPPDVRNGTQPFPVSQAHAAGEDCTPQVLAASESERLVTYRSTIRSAFAHRGSVLLVVPTTADIATYANHLSTGIEDRVVVFGSHQTKRAREKAYADFADLSKAKLIITTPSFAYLDRSDFTTTIIEQSASPHYAMRERPYLDHREVLITLARKTERSIILGDILPRTEDEAARRSDRFQVLREHPKRLELPAKLTIIKQTDKPSKDIPFQLFSPELLTRMQTTLSGRHNIFLFGARRGLAPVIACYDCGQIFRCPDSGTPYSLVRTHDSFGNEARWFVSGTSGKRVPAADVCDQCGSWRLRERGIGIQYVHDECKNHFPDVPVLLFDHTTATTHKKAEKIAQEFYDSKGAILIGTAMALPYLHQPVTLSAIVSLDAARSIPSWRADEQLFRLLLTLRERSTSEVMVQTRLEADDLLVYATRGAVERFFDDEIELREMLNYPPFSTLLLLSWQGSEDIIRSTEETIKKCLHNTTPATTGHYYTNPQTTPPKHIRHCLIRHPATTDITPLIATLRQLPPHIAITINPDRIV